MFFTYFLLKVDWQTINAKVDSRTETNYLTLFIANLAWTTGEVLRHDENNSKTGLIMSGNAKIALAIALVVCLVTADQANREDTAEKQGPGTNDHNSKGLKDVLLPASWIFRNKLIFTAGIIVLVLIIGLLFWISCLIRRNLQPKDAEEEEKILLKGRKVALPSSAVFRNGEKFALSNDFNKTHKEQKEPKEIYKETLIRKLNLSKV